MRQVKIMRGLPGAGKSTWAEANIGNGVIVSADHFFVSRDGYRFDAALLPKAHGACLRDFLGYVQSHRHNYTTVVVDNTNTTAAEIAPYYAAAEAYGWDVEIVEIDSMLSCLELFQRCRHGVPMRGVEAMADRLEREVLPPWWKHRVIVTGEPEVLFDGSAAVAS